MNSTVSISKKMTYYKGAFYGVDSPVSIVQVSVSKTNCADTSLLDHFLEENFLLDLYSQRAKDELKLIATEKNDALRLVKKLFCWFNEIHQLTNMPISNKTHITLLGEIDGNQGFSVAFNFFHQQVTQKVLLFLVKVFNSFLLHPQKTPVIESIPRFLKSLKKYSLPGTNRKHFLRAAIDLDIPHRTVVNSTLLFGHGVHQRKMLSSATDNTSVIGVNTVRNKRMCSEIMRARGFPVAPQVAVKSLADALAFAERMNYPVVLKPDNQDQGRGVTSNIKSKQDLAKVYKETSVRFKSLVLEKHIFGEDYRFCVVNGRVINIFHRVAGGIVGDGESNIRELVKQLQKTAFYRRKYIEKGKHLIKLDNEALSLLNHYGYTPGTIPKQGEYIPLRRKNNVSTGGTLKRVLNEEVHPDNLKLAIDVAESFGLDIAGIDIISTDITKTWLKSDAVVCEVNGFPEFGFSTNLELAHQLVKEVMQSGTRIPLHLILVDEQAIKQGQLENRILQNPIYQHGSIESTLIVNGAVFSNRMQNGFAGSQALLMNEKVDQAFFFLTLGLIQKYGLPDNQIDTIHITTKVADDLIAKIEAHTEKLVYCDLEDLLKKSAGSDLKERYELHH